MAVRQPVFYLTHGGGPSFWIDYPEPIGKGGFDGLKRYLEKLAGQLPEKPKAYLVISAHWEEDAVTLSTAKQPGMIYDYYGFPPIAYELKHQAPGSPDVARRAARLLEEAGLKVKLDEARGFDHGVFVPMMIVDPKAEVPTVCMSLRKDLDPAHHIAVGRALAPLRDEGVVIIGSGSSYHDLRGYFDGKSGGGAKSFDDWLTETSTHADPDTRNQRLVGWAKAPGARAAHPREEHLLPLMAAAGAAGDDVGTRDFHDTIANKPFSGYRFG